MKRTPDRRKPSAVPSEIELHPDAWERFTEFVKRIAKAGPQHRTKGVERIAKKQPKKRG